MQSRVNSPDRLLGRLPKAWGADKNLGQPRDRPLGSLVRSNVVSNSTTE